MKHLRLDRRLKNRLVIPAAFVLGSLALLIMPPSGWAQQGCIGWNCDGKSPCTGMGCGESSPSAGSSKDTKTGSTKSTGTGPGKSGAAKNTKPPSSAAKGPSKNTKSAPALPDVESLTGKSKNSDGWGGGRNSDTRTDDQAYQSEAKKTVEDLQNLTGGGKPPTGGWGGGLKSDSRTIEQKLDTP
jgi:hypothetical protein